jgi:hypothetical protein
MFSRNSDLQWSGGPTAADLPECSHAGRQAFSSTGGFLLHVCRICNNVSPGKVGIKPKTLSQLGSEASLFEVKVISLE